MAKKNETIHIDTSSKAKKDTCLKTWPTKILRKRKRTLIFRKPYVTMDIIWEMKASWVGIVNVELYKIFLFGRMTHFGNLVLMGSNDNNPRLGILQSMRSNGVFSGSYNQSISRDTQNSYKILTIDDNNC